MMNHHPFKGFSLIEVLIALFILAVGILGVIGLQLYAKQNNFDAIQRTAAAELATEIIERMRMNNTVLESYIINAAPVSAVAPTAMPTTCINSSAECTNAAIAAHDLAIWYSHIIGLSETKAGGSVGGLTEPSACIIRDPRNLGGTAGQREYRVVIAWRGRTPLSNSTRSTCGNDTTGARYGASDAYRRIYVLDAKID